MKIIDLFETPIEDISTVGDFGRSSSFRDPKDRAILSNPVYIQKVVDNWSKVKQPFNIYFVNNAEANRHTEVGIVNHEWLEKNMPKTYPELKIRDDAVNLIFTNNKGSARIQMTPWIMAHRLGHALNHNLFYRSAPLPASFFHDAEDIIERRAIYLLDEAYGIRLSRTPSYRESSESTILKHFYHAIGTMRAAREKNLRNHYEFYYECFAQYLITGEIKFNSLPSVIYLGKRGRSKFRGTEGDHQYYDSLLRDAADSAGEYFEHSVGASVGKILVM